MVGVLFACCFGLSACKHDQADKAAEEAPPVKAEVLQTKDPNVVQVQRADRFPLSYSVVRAVKNTIAVTGSVTPDVSREIPVVSLANGRVVALHVGLGDYVHKGQLLMEVQSQDVTGAFASYLKAVNDEHLTKVTLDRDTLLYGKGAIAQTQLQAAQNGEDDAVKIDAPASGIILSQNVTAAGAVGIAYGGPAGSLLIADLSHVWVICDVYENDLAQVHLGEQASIQVNALPGKFFTGTISDIGAQLDPALRTAKVRIQVSNPGTELRLGMFVTATLLGSAALESTAVPATAILALHDRQYIFVPTGATGFFRRIEVKTGALLDGNMIQILSGIGPQQRVVTNALDMQNTVDEE
jgi:cobalt-zinc-cadmium efflux system membrane fusion protein